MRGVGSDEFNVYIVYDSDKVREMIAAAKTAARQYEEKEGLEIDVDVFVSKLQLEDKWVDRVIKGMISVRSGREGAWGAAEVKRSAAQKGWGPLMYDIAMAGERGLMSDRSQPKSGAERVWSVYKGTRSDDVVSKLLDDEENPKTPSKEDDSRVYNGGERE